MLAIAAAAGSAVLAFCEVPLAAARPVSPRHEIVIDRSLDGVSLGESMSAVKAHLGHPSAVARCDGSYFTVCVGDPSVATNWIYGLSAHHLATGLETAYAFIGGKVALMGTFSHLDRTTTGVGPGASVRTLRRAYRHFAFHHFPFAGPPSGDYIGAPPRQAGDVFTYVVMDHNLVDWLEIGAWNPHHFCVFTLCS